MAQGPSAISQGVIAQALPGLSIFICVPTAMKSSMADIEAALQEPAASPDGRALPYLRRNPPGSRGAPKTGLPAMMSFMNLEITGTLRDLKPLPSPSLAFSFPLFAKAEMKSQPGTFSLSVCLWIFGAFKHKPSPITSKTPPRIRASSMFLTRPYPAHSMSSVDSPLTMTGHARTMVSTSSGGGLYCKFPRYNPNSSLTRSTSSSDGLYASTSNSLRIMSPISTARACAVPPAALIGPAK